MAFAVCGLVIGGSMAFVFLPKPVAEAPVVEVKTTTVNTFKRSAPTKLHIPKINLETTFVPPLWLNADKTVSVPGNYTEVGWYKGGVSPGEIGSAVILGHVDSYEGPAVFYSLGQLKAGDEIEVTREDSTTALFVVDELKRYPQDSFPTELVYGKTNTATLKLVTCTGIFNKGQQRYSHNLVVYAHLKE